MDLMICENAGKCNLICDHKEAHELSNMKGCCDGCQKSIKCVGSKCITYVPAIKPFDGAADLLAREQERKMAHVEAIIGKPLTDHAKYCRLSKQAGGLCACRYFVDRCVTKVSDEHEMRVFIPTYYSHCPYPEKQQQVELPKDPLEELIEKYLKANKTTYIQEQSLLREFAEKVRAL